MNTAKVSDLKQKTVQIYSLCKELLDVYGDDETELDEMKGVNDVIDEAANLVNTFQNSVLFHDFQNIRQTAYEKYQHDWMISHHIDEKVMDQTIQEYVADIAEDEVPFSEWLFERGFGGSIWACFNEFFGAEYQDKEYMKTLLTEEEYQMYETDIRNF